MPDPRFTMIRLAGALLGAISALVACSGSQTLEVAMRLEYPAACDSAAGSRDS